MEIGIISIIIGLAILLSSVLVICAKSPILSALYLLASLFLSGFYFIAQSSYFIGAVQILVYAGAIAVLFVFVLMLLDLNKDTEFEKEAILIPGIKSVLTTISLFSVFAFFVYPKFKAKMIIPKNLSKDLIQGESISYNLLTDHMVSFQMAGFLLLAAVIGVVVLGRRVFDSSDPVEEKQ